MRISKAQPRKQRKTEITLAATPESTYKKMVLVGRGGDPVLGESPVGVLVARKLISPTDEHHLKDVARLWKFRYGSPAPATIREATGPNDHDSDIKTQRYKDVHRVLGDTWLAVIEVAVYQEFPRWLLAEIGLVQPTANDRERMKQFETGLFRLERIWGRVYST